MPPSAFLELARHGPTATIHASRADGPLRIATVIPSFRRGSGGHATIVRLMRELQARGHDVTLWLEDCEGRHARERSTLTQSSFTEFFDAGDLRLNTSFSLWSGANVVLATGWQTVARALLLTSTNARAYLVQDHEPDFYAVSTERLLAEQTYRQGLHCIAASEWLAKLLSSRYGASASHFNLAVDHKTYHTTHKHRRDDLVVFYARAVTPRRAVPLGLSALTELAHKRQDVEIALFGEDRLLDAPFAHTNLGVLPADELATLYRRATVGMVLSLTNPSLIGLEMMASGLPCVEAASDAMVASFGLRSPMMLAKPEPLELCRAIEGLLDDPNARERAARAGIEAMADRTWARAAEQVERSLYNTLATHKRGTVAVTHEN